MTKAELHEKYGIRMLLSPQELYSELSPQEARDYEELLVATQKWHEEIEENIKIYCSRCKYYETEDSVKKCDSWIHGSSYGVDCKYIGKAKGEDMSQYENRKIIDL